MQVTEELKAYLKEQSLALLCLPLDLGSGQEAVLLVKATRDLAEGLRGAQAPVEVGWVVHATETGPAVCLVLRAAAENVGELDAEVYFDAADDDDLDLLGRLGSQERLRAAFLDEDLAVVWLAEIPWDEVRRLQAEQVRDRAEELLERADEYDFDRSRELFQEEVPFGELLARAFPA